VLVAGVPVLSTVRLNRALLARQLLLRRRRMSPLQAIEHLVGIQSQAPRAAYVGLWTRISPFRPETLERLLTDRAVVRVALMRSTIHLVTAADCLPLRQLVRPAIERASRHSAARRAAGVDDAELAAAGRELVDAAPRTFGELGAELRRRWPGCDADALAMGVRELVPLVQVPPRGLWSRGGAPAHAAAETWLAGVRPARVSKQALVRRYLAAYGPASVRDAQTFAGVTGLRRVFDELRPELDTFRDEADGELFDLPGSPRPAGRTRAPVRFLPEFDNVLLSHARRERILPAGTMSLLSLGNGLKPAFLAGGFVAGTWRLRANARSATLEVEPFERLPAAARRELDDEGRRLLRFAARGTARTELVVR
jgi:Winged helix DNA-binding domain